MWRKSASTSGSGAVVPWAGSLWVVTYGPHCPMGSSDKLNRIAPDLTRTTFPGSIGGTPANRLIHRETNQLLIGPYVIDAAGQVRTIPYARMPGRLTGAARHLTDPSRLVYVATMDNGLYELDMNTLGVRTLLRDDVKAGDISDPFLHAGYDDMRFTFTDASGQSVPYELIQEGDWMRVKALASAKGVSAHFRYGPKRPSHLPAYKGFIEVRDDDGAVHRFPNVNGDKTVICREVATERDLLYAGGVFYEVPADNAGGFRELRPIALSREPVRSIEAKLGLVSVNGKPMALDSLWRNGTAAEAYWLWEDVLRLGSR